MFVFVFLCSCLFSCVCVCFLAFVFVSCVCVCFLVLVFVFLCLCLFSCDCVCVDVGAIFCAHTMTTSDISIGRFFHCNIYYYIEHDCIIGDFVTFSPRVSCNGYVHISDDVFVGAGAIIRNGSSHQPLRVGQGAVIGMGAVVTKDVPSGCTVVGNPARVVSVPLSF